MRRSQVRAIAEELGLYVAHKPDSMEICFVPDQDYARFIEENSGKKIPEGNFVDDRREDRRASSRNHPLYRRTAQGAESLDGEAGICAGDPAGDK